MRSCALSYTWKPALGALLISHAFAQNPSLQERIAQGISWEARGEFKLARSVLNDAAQDAERGGSNAILLAAALDGLASVDRDEGRYLDAERHLLRALSITEHVTGPESPSTGLILWHLIGAYGESGRVSAADPLLRRYEAIVLRHAGENTLNTADNLCNLGRIYALRNAVAKALPLFERAIAIIETHPDGNEIGMGRALLDRGSAFAVLGHLDEAVADVERARAVVASLHASYPVLEIQLHATAGMVYARARRSDDATASFEESMQIAETSYGASHPIMAIVLRDYSQALRLLGRKKEASAMEKRAGRILSASNSSNPLGHAVDIEALRPR
jgi:eukaryotic-like serine/threonine-protein kinase